MAPGLTVRHAGSTGRSSSGLGSRFWIPKAYSRPGKKTARMRKICRVARIPPERDLGHGSNEKKRNQGKGRVRSAGRRQGQRWEYTRCIRSRNQERRWERGQARHKGRGLGTSHEQVQGRVKDQSQEKGQGKEPGQGQGKELETKK